MKEGLLQYELKNVDELIPYINNARTHTDEQINKVAASIKEFGFLNPILISDENVITAGHCRLLAAKKLGLKKVPCILENHLTEAQRKAYVLADNKLSLDAGWDEELLRVEIESLEDYGFNVELTGFSEEELDQLFDLGNDTEDDDFDVEEELEKPTFSKAGDIWTLGKHKLICGDSTDETTYEKLMGESQANLIITDPPYNVNYEGSA
ncbi:MAG: ParB N-terminal domain-containing protein, partial [Peptoniphilus harei]